MHRSIIVSNAERLSQLAVPHQNQNHQGTRSENSIEVHERNSMQIEAQLGSFSVSEGSEAPRTQCQSVLGKRNISEVLASGEVNIMMQANEHMNIMGLGSSTRRIFPKSMRVPDQEALQALQAETSHQPLDMSDQLGQLLQPMQSKPTSQESVEMFINHDPHNMLIQQDKGQEAYLHKHNIPDQPQRAVWSWEHTIYPHSWNTQDLEPTHQLHVQNAQRSFLPPNNQNSLETPQAPIKDADDGISERFLSIVALTQRHNLDKGKQTMSNQVHHKKLVLSRIPLVAEFLQQSSETERAVHLISSDPIRTDTDAYVFAKGNGHGLKARRSLLISKKPSTEVHDCRIIHEIDHEVTSFLQPRQYDGIGAMTTNGPYGTGSSSDNNILHANAAMGIQSPLFQPSMSNLPQSNAAASIITQDDLEYPWLFTIAGNQTTRVPILLPYSTFPVQGQESLDLAGSYQLPPIPSDVVVPVHTPCIITMQAAATLLSMARSRFHSGQIIQQLQKILDNYV